MKNVEDLNLFIMGIVGIGILLAVGLITLSQLSTSVQDEITATSFTNQSLTWTNATAVSFVDATCIVGSGVCGTLYNQSDNAVTIAADNYTCSNDALTFVNRGDYYSIASLTNTSYLTYTCKVASSAYTANNSMIAKLATAPTWIGILITVALAFLVLGYFYNKN